MKVQQESDGLYATKAFEVSSLAKKIHPPFKVNVPWCQNEKAFNPEPLRSDPKGPSDLVVGDRNDAVPCGMQHCKHAKPFPKATVRPGVVRIAP